MNVGVMGGTGPLASAKFVNDLYHESNRLMVEQQRPDVIALHQSSFPDRTAALLSGKEQMLLDKLVENLDKLRQLGCQDIIVTCFTLHSVFDKLKPEDKAGLHDLLALVRDLTQQHSRYLVLCTNGSRHSQLFDRMFAQHHPTGCNALVYPDNSDQELVHKLLYDLKAGENAQRLWPEIENVLNRYAVDGIVAGCTEIYLWWQQLQQYCQKNRLQHVDALLEIRTRLSQMDRRENC
jgi:aspartate racemase